MSEYLPEVYTSFRNAHPEVAGALDTLAATVDGEGSMAASTSRLIKLGIAIGAGAEGSVRSNVRKALEAGVPRDDVLQAGLLAITTVGFPSAMAALGWIGEVLEAD
jgi:alkylhydroperoxidase/carboxymuconolactone decarboxylase family protein YurZ